jgi:hypothetical protein
MARDLYCKDDIRNGISAALLIIAQTQAACGANGPFMSGAIAMATGMYTQFGIPIETQPWGKVAELMEEGGRDTHHSG